MGKWLDMLQEDCNAEVEFHERIEQQSDRKLPANVTAINPSIPPVESPDLVHAAINRIVNGLEITADEFRELIDEDEALWIATGRIPMKTARAYAKLFADDLVRGGMK